MQKWMADSIKDELPKNLKIPHIGWNPLLMTDVPAPVFAHIRDKDPVYFVHSFQAVCPDENILARTEYGALLTAAVRNRNVFGCQFHPEKSGEVGLKILKAFCEK